MYFRNTSYPRIILALTCLLFHHASQAMSNADGSVPEIFHYTLFDRFEYEANTQVQLYKWEMYHWSGTDTDKFYIKSEGDYAISQNIVGTADLQLLYSRAITDYWDIQVGARRGFQPEQAYDGVISIQGTASQFVEFELESFYNQYGNILGRLTLQREFQFTQYLIATPRLEVDVTKDRIAPRNINPGIYELEAGIRLRYEIVREFAPYIGFDYVQEQSLMEAQSGVRGVVGFRAWY